MIATLQGRSGVNGVLGSSEFFLPAYDLGSGAVDTALGRGVGVATFTRATAAAAKLSTGLWKRDVASGVARSSYIGLTTAISAYGGYFAEGARTQLAVDPLDMTQASWVKVNVSALKNAVGIDGVANSACTLTSAAIGASILQTLVAAASTRTYSAWIRRVSGTGTITISQGATTLDVTASINASTYTCVQLPASVLNSAFGITFGASGDVIEVDCNQFEAGAFASTPIPAAGVRNADVLTYAFAGNALTTAGTAYAELSTNIPSGIGNAVALSIGSFDGRVLWNQTSAASTTIDTYDGTSIINKAGLTSLLTGVRKRVSSWGTGQTVGGDGAALASGAFDGAMGTTAGIGIGCDYPSGTEWFGTTKNNRIWLRQLPTATQQAITA